MELLLKWYRENTGSRNFTLTDSCDKVSINLINENSQQVIIYCDPDPIKLAYCIQVKLKELGWNC